ncbi:MAG: serine hydrolase [Saprospiraceae bacterium]|nr:serine hydrolase [Saprospiraceae bacterium]
MTRLPKPIGAILILFVAFFILPAFFWQSSPVATTPASEKSWVDSIYDAMTDAERVGQLFMVRAHSNKGTDHTKNLENLIREYHLGGLCFFQGTPEKQAELSNRFQKLSNIPLLISMDAEWGLEMRFKEDAMGFPKALTLGAIQDNRLIYDMGTEIARQCVRLGVHINFAPVADVNNNPANPVINYRSFGEDRINVAAKSYMYMLGMQDHGLVACAKHFPGHGDTDVDSHLDLPILSHPRARLDSIELFPFQILADQHIKSMMIAHLQVPEIDSAANMPTSLSAKAIEGILRNEMHFEGVIITDGLGMAGVTKHHKPGDLEVEAIKAGNDILLLPENVPAAALKLLEYMNSGTAARERIAESVKRILRMKYELGLDKTPQIKVENIRADINTPSAYALRRKLIRRSLTLVRNNDQILPIRDIDTLDMASLSIGASSMTAFQKQLGAYAAMDHFQADKSIGVDRRRELLQKLGTRELVFVSLHDLSSQASNNYGISKSAIEFIEALRKRTKVVLVHFGNPYALKYFDGVACILQAYEEENDFQELAAQAVFGAYSIDGKLPVTASPGAVFGQGLYTPDIYRLGYGLPEEVGMSSDLLLKIDTIANEAVDKGATPGCVVLVVKDGQVVFEKAYGYHTYSRKRKTTTEDIFDLASITKVAATTVSVMKLHEEQKIGVFEPLSWYLPQLDSTNKAGMTIDQIMAHRAGLISWIPFYEQTITSKGYPMKSLYHASPSDDFNIEVAENLYLQFAFRDSIWSQIYNSRLSTKKGYWYSDLGFYLLAKMVEEVSGRPLNQYAQDAIYRPLGLQTMGYLPLERFPMNSIVPTEEDKYFRRRRIQGHVHDMGAAMLGGVSGHAGLFSNARDMAILMQMLLNKGYYGGEFIIDPNVVQLFTSRCTDCTRRGLGFDMRQLDTSQSLNMCDQASDQTFGHLGFTGTAVWADPAENLIYVFLSNRTYPSMNNYKLNKLDIRPRIQSAIYEAIIEHDEKRH